MKIINDVEENFPVHEWTIDGIHIWPLIRLSLSSSLHRDNSGNESTKNKTGFKYLREMKSIIKSLYGTASAALHDPKQNSHFNDGQADVVFLVHSRSRILLEDKWYIKNCDPFVEEFERLGLRTFTLEYAPDYHYKVPRYNSSMYIQMQLDWVRIKNHFQRTKTKLAVEMKDYEEFVQYLENQDILVPAVQEICKNVVYIRRLAHYYKNILSRLNARLGMAIYYYGSQGMAFNLACEELGIPSVDIQHGVQGEMHRAYGRWLSVPRHGYELLPEYFWCWSNSEAGIIQEWSDKNEGPHQAIAGGNLWLNEWKKGDNQLLKNYIEKISPATGDPIQVLVTLQPDRYLPDFLVEAIKQSSSGIKWWVRLHPRMLSEREHVRNKLESEGMNNVSLDEATNLPLHALLSVADIHVTEWSSTVLEAKSFGVKSIILHEIGKEVFKDELKSELVTTAFTKEEILNQIEKKQKDKQIAFQEEVEQSSQAIDELIHAMKPKRDGKVIVSES